MKKLNKKQKLTALFAGLVAVCAISFGVLYVSGVLPAQSKGNAAYFCSEPGCSCHTSTGKCKKCDKCCYKHPGKDPNFEFFDVN